MSITPLPVENPCGQYIKDDNGNVIPCTDTRRWGEWFQNNNRTVSRTTVCGIRISTVFLALDHSHTFQGKPVLWETMFFSSRRKWNCICHYWQARYTSEEEAMECHNKIVTLFKSGRSLHWIENKLEEL